MPGTTAEGEPGGLAERNRPNTQVIGRSAGFMTASDLSHFLGTPSRPEGRATSATCLLLIRHGQSHATVDQVVAGRRSCRGLTERGRSEADQLARRLASEAVPVHVLLTSPVARARETADAVSARLRLGPPVIDPDVRELDFGDADGLSTTDYARRYGTFDMVAEPDRPFAPGGESWSAFRGRAWRTMHRLADQYRRRTALVICHAGFIVAASAALLNVPPPGFDTDQSPASTSITKFVHDGTRWSLVRYNDQAHITGANN
jgi:broad specificity phosphatase PhoE